MDNALIVALAKWFKTQAENVALPVGVYPLDTDITLSVKGAVEKFEDQQYTPTVDIPLLPTLALVLEKAGFQRERAKDLLIEAMTDALNAQQEANTDIENRIKDVQTAMQHVRQVTQALPKKTRSGRTTVAVAVQEVEPVPVF